MYDTYIYFTCNNTYIHKRIEDKYIFVFENMAQPNAKFLSVFQKKKKINLKHEIF